MLKQGLFEIKENVALTETMYKMVLVGDASAISAPGQFVNIKLDGYFLRRPISVCDYNENEFTYSGDGYGRCDHPQQAYDDECFDMWVETIPEDYCSYGERREEDTE